MKASLAIKTLFRTVGKTLFTFLLIAVLTFSLFIQTSEYFKTAAEFNANVEMYRGTGFVEYRPALLRGKDLQSLNCIGSDPRLDVPELVTGLLLRYQSLSTETTEAISSLPYVTVYKRYMTAGVSDQYVRMQDNPAHYDYNERIILEGTLDRYEPEETFTSPPNRYYLRDVKLLAGDASIEDIAFDDGTVFFSDWHYRLGHGRPYRQKLVEGDRYVVVCLFDRRHTNRGNPYEMFNKTRESLQLYDLISEHAWPAVCNITDAPENYLELPDYAPLKKLTELTKADLYTFDVVYTDDMSAIQRVHDNTLHIAEGRWLTPEDTAQNAKVCIVDKDLAKQYNLKLGETLSLKLGNSLFEQFYGLGAIAGTEERFADEWTQDEFEIVGFYTGSTMAKDANAPNWAYSVNTVFVPLSSLPLTEGELEGHEFAPGEITFRVENAWDIGPFLQESAPQIEDMGLTLTFDDAGWMPVLEEYHDAQRLPLIRIILLSFVTVVGLALSVYLFVSRKKKDYAVMRALGTPKGRSAKALLAPLTVLTAAALVFGVAAGVVYSRVVIGAVFPLPVLISIGGELAFTLAFAGLSIRRLSKKPPLLLLQDSQAKAKKSRKKQAAEAVQGTLYVPTDIRISYEPLPISKRPGALSFRLRYVRRHIRRQGVKSALAVLLAALMVGAITQLASLRDTYNELRETTVVPVQFINSMSQIRLQPLVDDGLAENVYYERTPNISCLYGTVIENAELVLTPDIARCINQEYEIMLGDGYTEDDIGKLDHVLLGVDFMKQYDIQPGDIVRFGTEYDFNRIFSTYTRYYLDEFYYSKDLVPEAPPTRDEVYEYYRSEIDRKLNLLSADAEVIGYIRTESGAYQSSVFTAGLDDGSSLVGIYQTMPLIEFTLSDNSYLEEMRQRGEEMTYGRKGAFVMDTEKLESVSRTSNLLNGLYLPVIALALLIGAALCALMVMQTTKDAAIMRALGTTKRTTRSMLAMEQILLGVLGIILGLGIMLAMKGEAFMDIALQAGLFAVAYALVLIVSSYVSAALATKKNILELLQTKE